ncbi:PmbA protein [Carboxydocella sporoproducens DSM 16521]|uniref:PmbA protein n=2 Tax=Carboxydocella TaxID=178898 RepID=A0A1T4S8Y7_9FIRM|nr:MULTISPECIES: TldD/PmbA family protein [Carboxydocella]AVX20127.1 PmbA protein [Carboxydocella thermautotrophica]AVX30546.1 PmbA protein [Carboxydocella thermautotrophica]SKA24760.1 PmbA protein [Carboxydocella sporoproducens DSM 16521]
MKQEELLRIGEQALAYLKKAGTVEGEIYLSSSRELSVDVANSQVETLKMAEEQGLGIRVFREGKLGFAYTSDFSPAAVQRAVEQALANAVHTAADPAYGLPENAKDYPELQLLDPLLAQTPVETKIELAKRVEAQAHAADPRVKITESCGYSESQYTIAIVNTRGLKASYEGGYCGAYAFVVAEDKGEAQTGYHFNYALDFNSLNPEEIGREAGLQAARMLGAEPLTTATMPVVFAPRIATAFLGVLAPALSAEAVQKGKSLFAGKIGSNVAAPLVTLIDDGRRPGAIMSAPFDGEGVPSQETILIQAGRLDSFLYNTYAARKEGKQSTGNGQRPSGFKGTPEIGTTNFFLAPGPVSPEQLLAEIEYGFYVTEVMGMHTANPISGDFSVGAAGFLIEKGQLTKPVRGVALAGNLAELLQKIDAIADDLTFFGGKGSPTVRIQAMPVSGK